ncbi:MAG TPA: haloalkane dehalogenase, partial [Paraburkholderia sp.]|nr:haloalkane dehalogenase [Paraburkholderia sp.]
IDYRFVDHVRYLDAFIDALGLKDVVLVGHEWGAALAFHYAARRPERIAGLAFMEFIRPFPGWDRFHQRALARELFKVFRTPGQGEKLILDDNVFIERIFLSSVLREMSDVEKAVYRAPFPTPASRKPILQLTRELPIAGEPADVHALMEEAHGALRASTYPKLLFYTEPGALVSPEAAQAFASQLVNCRLVDAGPGAHYLQEDYPELIGDALRTWVASECARDALVDATGAV